MLRLLRRILRRLIDGPNIWTLLEREGVVSAGVGTYGQHFVEIPQFRLVDGSWGAGGLKIGRYCALAPCLVLLGGNHRSDWVTQYNFGLVWRLPGNIEDATTKGDVVLGNDVWIGMNSIILSGVEIGDGAAVAAGAVVTKSVRPYAIVAGNPAREIGRRFDDETVDRLLESRWWDWSEEEIRAELPTLLAPPASGFNGLQRPTHTKVGIDG